MIRSSPFPGLLIGVLLAALLLLTGCGGTTRVLGSAPVVGLVSHTPQAAQKLGFPVTATKNTTRVGGGDPIADAAAVALAVYPSAAPGTHPTAVALAPSDNWPAALATASLMAPPLRVPLLISDAGSAPSATADALSALAPTGSTRLPGTPSLIRIGDAAAPGGAKAKVSRIGGSGDDGPKLAAAIDRYEATVRGRTSRSVIIASTDAPAYAMPAAGLAAESGQPILYVTAHGIPAVTRVALITHGHPRIYVLGPPSVISDRTLNQLGRLGTAKRIGAQGPEANSVAFAVYRDPDCPSVPSPCAHIADSFGWALRSPGHGYTLVNSRRPLDAAAAAALSASGSYGPILLVSDAASLPQPVLNYFLDYATPAYSASGPTAAVYNHGWVIGDPSAVSVAVQAQFDSLLEVVPEGR